MWVGERKRVVRGVMVRAFLMTMRLWDEGVDFPGVRFVFEVGVRG